MIRRFASIGTALLVATAACDDAVTGPESLDGDAAGPASGPIARAFTPGGTELLTGSAHDAWPELEGNHVAWYRAAPAEEQGLWLMDLRTRESARIWAGEVEGGSSPAFEMVDGLIVWGSADALLSYDIASATLEPLADTYRHYRDVSVGPDYIVGTAREGVDRPFVYHRRDGSEEMILTAAAVPATRGSGNRLVYSYALTNTVAQIYRYDIPTGIETPVTDQGQVLSAALSDISGDHVAYTASRWCPARVELYDIGAAARAVLDMPAQCPAVILLDGHLLVYREKVAEGLGVFDVDTGDHLGLNAAEPANGRFDADLDGTRLIHSSAEGLVLLDLRFQEGEPPVADAGGPYVVMEGSELTLDGSGSESPSGEPLTYRWTLEGGATLDGVAPGWTWNDDGTPTVTLTVSDPSGLSDDDQGEVTVKNADPLIMLGGGAASRTASDGLHGVAGDPVTLVARFRDPGVLDAPWAWSVSWDEGELASGSVEEQGELPPVRWVPRKSGRYTVVVRVEDKDGGVATVEMALEVDNRPPLLLRVHAGSGPRNTAPSLQSNGVFPVVAFGSQRAPAEDFDLESFSLSPTGTAGPPASPLTDGGHAPLLEDRDEDGILDAVFTFRVRDAGLTPETTEVCLTGRTRSGTGVTMDGEQLHGCSPIRIAGERQR